LGELLGRWATAVDANLNALPAARLHTFDSVATTVTKATYSDPELTTPHANPVVANASGQFPQIFADVGESFYLVLKTSAGVLVEDFEQVDALGNTGSGSFDRDFGAGGRWSVAGAAGVVRMEFGPPTGDDIGGIAELGGQDGTQGQTLEVDFAETTITGDVAIVGELEVTSDTVPFPKLLTRGTVTAQAALELALDDSFSEWEVRVRDLLTSGGNPITGQISVDSAATYKAAAGDYVYVSIHQASGGAGATTATDGTYVQLTNATPTTAADGLDAVIRITSKTSRETRMMANWIAISATSGNCLTGQSGGGTKAKAYGKATNVKLAPTAGTFTCDYAVYGVR